MKISNAIKKELQIDAITRIKGAMINSDEKKFRASLQLGALYHQALEWYSNGGKELLKVDNPNEAVNQDVFCIKVLGARKQWVHKCAKASEISADVVEKFISIVRELSTQGHIIGIGIDALNKFVKDGEQIHVKEETATDETASEETASEETETEETATTILTLAYVSNTGKNVALRLSSTGELITGNSADEIREALAILTEKLAEIEG